MTGDVMRAGEQLLVDWDDLGDEEPLLTFSAAAGKPATLTMAKVDPDGDFSSDYEDLFFTRIGACAAAPPAVPLSDASAAASVDALMHDYAGNAPGASVLVLRDGKPVIQRSYGLANLEDRTPATSATNYRLASITKQFTAAAILLLAEAGKLGLDDPIRKWLPTLPEAAQPVTIRHLLTHTGGLIDYEDFVPDDAPQVRDADVLGLLEKQNRTYFAAGSSYRYSNSGYALLSLIVEKASGQRFAAFLRERIFEPLGMKDTVAFEDGVSTVASRAFGYSARGDALDAHRPELHQRRARRWRHLLVDERPGEMGRGALRRPAAAQGIPGAGLHAGHAHRQSQHRLRVRLARHGRNPLALGRDARIPQRDRAVSGA